MIPPLPARFIFLGTGTSGGVPLIACDCATCTSDDPRDERTRTAAAVQWIDPDGCPRCVLIDAGPDLHRQARRHDLWRCDAILFTHNHVDHIFGVDEVRRFNAVMRAPIEIHAEGYVLESLKRVYKHIFDKDANINDSFVATLIAHEVPPPPADPRAAAPAIPLWGMSFTPIRLMHGRLPVLGWRIEPSSHPPIKPSSEEQPSTHQAIKPSGAESELDGSVAGCPEAFHSPFPLAYCTDVSAIPPETWPRLRGLRMLVLDALRHRHHPTHLTLAQAIAIAAEVGADQTRFIHIAHEIKHADTEGALPESMALAHDGLVLGSLGEAGERAFAEDKARMADAMRRREKIPAKAAAKERFEEG